jgi:S-DNA-T family DNA segregation ATPase FtsK/SpoIIIE
MAKKKKNKKNKKIIKKRNEKLEFFVLPEKVKKWILGIIIFVLVIIIILSFFDLAGTAGKKLMEIFDFLIGKTIFIIPFILLLGGIVFFRTKQEKFLGQVVLSVFILIIGISGILGTISPETKEEGGYLGYLASLPFLIFFGILATQIIFLGIILIGLLIFWHLLGINLTFLKKKKEEKERSLAFQAFKKAQFKVKKIESQLKNKEILVLKKEEIKNNLSDLKIKPLFTGKEYKTPPLDLLISEKGRPSVGDTTINSAIIKETLKNFGLDVEMGEINIGPTVTQYTLKPAEGIKLSKITSLSNNLSLALASSSIRIEAPIPGKSLVGVEIPNKERCSVRLKELISNSCFQEANSNLVFILGRDVSGNPCYADLSKMPHLLVAGSTGTGKTIFLNNFILSLLYRNSPEILRIILIDPKRVEFSAYQGLPHLLAPVIFDAQKTINVLKWLIKEMERRFDVLSGNSSRDILSYNEKVLKEKNQPIPYIVLIIDELADLMAARGREMEAGIVRLAQMARAVGIHLVLATQRPSVEVITGLIKANITSRIAFQVASQVDSRTIIDMAGAEKLLGAGDMLFISAQTIKPKRMQGAYVTEKEVKKVINYIKTESPISDEQKGELEKELTENHLTKDLEKSLSEEIGEFNNNEEDPLYQEAKKIVIIAKKASSSLLQRRLSIGYARAARLIDLLEERGVIGPGEGAKPREVYFSEEIENTEFEKDEQDWKKI